MAPRAGSPGERQTVKQSAMRCRGLFGFRGLLLLAAAAAVASLYNYVQAYTVSSAGATEEGHAQALSKVATHRQFLIVLEHAHNLGPPTGNSPAGASSPAKSTLSPAHSSLRKDRLPNADLAATKIARTVQSLLECHGAGQLPLRNLVVVALPDSTGTEYIGTVQSAIHSALIGCTWPQFAVIRADSLDAANGRATQIWPEWSKHGSIRVRAGDVAIWSSLYSGHNSRLSVDSLRSGPFLTLGHPFAPQGVYWAIEKPKPATHTSLLASHGLFSPRLYRDEMLNQQFTPVYPDAGPELARLCQVETNLLSRAFAIACLEYAGNVRASNSTLALTQLVSSLPAKYQEAMSRPVTPRLGRTVLVVVLNTQEKVAALDAMWLKGHDSFFSVTEQDVVIAPSRQVLDSGVLDKQWWSSANTAIILPRELCLDVAGDLAAADLLEITALAFTFTLPHRYTHVVVVPFDRVPLIVWTETESVCSMSSMRYDMRGNNVLESKPSASRMELQCAVGVCHAATPKSVSFEHLFSAFVSRNTRLLTELARDIWLLPSEHGSNLPGWIWCAALGINSTVDTPLTAINGRRGRKFAVNGTSRRKFAAENFSNVDRRERNAISRRVLVEAKSNEGLAFSSAITDGGSTLHPSIISSTQQALSWDRVVNIANHAENKGSNKLEERRVFQEQGLAGFQRAPRISNYCYHELVGQGIVGYRPSRVPRSDLRHVGVPQMREVAELLERTVGKRPLPTSPTFRKFAFVVLVHEHWHLQAMQKVFVTSQDSPWQNQTVVLVPDKRVNDHEPSCAVLSRLKKEKNVIVLPMQYQLKGVWGGASLAFKGIIGQLWAALKVPDVTHVVLLSGDSIPIASMARLQATSCPDVSHIDRGAVPEWEFKQRLGALMWECDGKNFASGIRRIVPQGVKDNFRKGSQWNVMSSKDLWDLFTPSGTWRQIVDDLLPIFGSMLIADEHLMPTIFAFITQGSEYEKLATATNFSPVYLSWSGGGHHPDFLTPDRIVVAAKSADQRRWFARKIESLEVVEESLRALRASEELSRVVESVSCPYESWQL